MSSINPISFCGKLVRTKRTDSDFSKSKPHAKGLLRSDIIKSYDDSIKELTAYRDYAIKLDDLMVKDKDIQAAIKGLPNGFQVNMVNVCRFLKGDKYEANPTLPFLEVNQEDIDNSPKARNRSSRLPDNHCFPSKGIEEAPDKKKILGWLNELMRLYKN